MGNKINININDMFSLEAESGISIKEIAKSYKKISSKCIMGAKINNIIVDYDTIITKDEKIEFFDYMDPVGNKIYQAGLKFVMIIAIKELWNKSVSFKYSLDKGIVAEIDKRMQDTDILELKTKMREIINYNFDIIKRVTKRRDARTYYLSTQEDEKATNISSIPNSYVELYEINHVYNYFYSDLPASTGELDKFDIVKLDSNSLILMYPRIDYNGKVPPFIYNEKVYEQLVKYNKWSKKMNIPYVSGVNSLVSESKIQMFIKMNNIFVNDSLYSIAKDIVKKSKVTKLILIGGPSSSGKTTSAHKLQTYLEAFGIKPIVISADDYFKDRCDTPKDENGNYDFESLNAIDIDLFNTQIKQLLKGDVVKMPTYNFIEGKKEYVGDPVTLDDENILLIEGLHCLNDAMTKKIPRENKYKIFVCPFTPTSIDRHNHISTTDMRLIRRIVRDNRVRGKNVEDTLAGWDLVKTGENKYIFPYIGDVDSVLNTAFAYEVGILRVFAEPLLYSVHCNSEYYEQARRLLGFLRSFYPISSEYIEDDNILREFIGGSIYEK